MISVRSKVGDFVGGVAAVDLDTSDRLTYSMNQNGDNQLQIDSSTGEISFLSQCSNRTMTNVLMRCVFHKAHGYVLQIISTIKSILRQQTSISLYHQILVAFVDEYRYFLRQVLQLRLRSLDFWWLSCGSRP